LLNPECKGESWTSESCSTSFIELWTF
jgi:hypothetical protein